jgi:hypothetical protein
MSRVLFFCSAPCVVFSTLGFVLGCKAEKFRYSSSHRSNKPKANHVHYHLRQRQPEDVLDQHAEQRDGLSHLRDSAAPLCGAVVA